MQFSIRLGVKSGIRLFFDEGTPLGRIFAHIKFESGLLHRCWRCSPRMVRRMSSEMKLLNSLGEIFTESLEARHLGLTDFLEGLVAFLFAIAIDRSLFVAHAEERRFEKVNVPRMTKSSKKRRK